MPVVVDMNPRKHGTFLPGTGQRIISADALVGYRPDAVIVMDPVDREQVGRDLEARGLCPELMTL